MNLPRMRFVGRNTSALLEGDAGRKSVPRIAAVQPEGGGLQVAQQGSRHPAQLFNNRSLEKLFGPFESVKFFLTRERLREVIVKV